MNPPDSADRGIVRHAGVLVCLGAALLRGQVPDPRAAMETSLARQRSAIELQRLSVRKQVAPSTTTDFFTVPWSDPAPDPVPVVSQNQPDCDQVSKEEIGTIIEDAARRDGLTPDLLRAVISKESAFRPCAVSPKGAQGLMQLMPATSKTFGVINPFDPKQNVEAGSRFLKQLLSRYGGDLALALGAYNAGPARVDAQKGVPLIPETLDYVSDILGKLRAKPGID